jgi:hypothetical protein
MRSGRCRVWKTLEEALGLWSDVAVLASYLVELFRSALVVGPETRVKPLDRDMDGMCSPPSLATLFGKYVTSNGRTLRVLEFGSRLYLIE